MEKKLALLLGILVLLPVAHFSGAAFQVKASATSDSDLEISSGSGNTETSHGKNSGLDSVVNHTEDDGVNLENKTKSGGKTKSKKGHNLRKVKEGSADRENRKLDDSVVIKDVLEKEENKHQVRRSKSDLENNEVDGNSRQKGSEKDSNGGSKQDDGVRPRREREKQGNEDQVEGLNVDDESSNDTSDSIRQTETENNDHVGKEDSMDDKKGKQNAGVRTEKVSEEKKNGDGVTSDPKKEGSSGDECYSSIMCTDEEKKLIACLRVPGNESPHLSLLIQNKDNDSLTVDISAPDFVQLDTSKVQIGEKQNKKVEVSIGNGGTDSLITLTSGNRVCNLDFKDLITQGYSPNLKYLNLPARRPTIAFLSFSALLILVSAWMFVNIRRKKLSSKGYTYQKVDTGLPVSSSGGKQRLKENDGWDESWGDDWNDEEAPQTPSKPSPSLSSKRLASRRLSKETWKD